MARNLNIETKLQGDKAVKTKLKGIGAVGAKSAASIAAGYAGAALAIAGAVKAVQGIRRAFDAAVGASNVQLEAISSLNAALESHGNATDTASQAVQRYAAELQKVTSIGDEVTIGIASQIEAMTGLAEDGLINATQAAIQLSKAFKIDLKAAASLVGKELTSTTSALTRYGIQIDKTGTQQEQLTELLEGTKAGMAIARAEVELYSGKVKQLENIYGDLQESIGGFLTQNPEVLNAIDAVKIVISEATKLIDEYAQQFTETGNETTTSAKDMALVIGQTFGDIGIAIASIGVVMTTAVAVVKGAVDVLSIAMGQAQVVWLELASGGKADTSGIIAKIDEIRAGFFLLDNEIQDSIDRVGQLERARDRLIAGISSGFESPRAKGSGGRTGFGRQAEEIEVVTASIKRLGGSSSKAAKQVEELLTPLEKVNEAVSISADGVVVLGSSWRELETPLDRAATVFERLNEAIGNAALSAAALNDTWLTLTNNAANFGELSLFPQDFKPPSQIAEGLRRGLRSSTKVETTDLGGGLAVDCVTMPDGSVQCGAPYTKGDKSKPADRSAGGFFEGSLGRGLIGGAAQAIGGNVQGGITSVIASLAGPFAPIVNALGGLFGGKKSTPIGTRANPIYNIMLNPQDIATAFLSGTQAAQARGAGAGLSQLNQQRLAQRQVNLAPA